MIQSSDVARRFCVALDKGDWMIVAELTDPGCLREFADDRLEHARAVEGGSDSRMLAGGPPDAPPEVRTCFAERAGRAFPKSSLPEEFAGVATVAALEKLKPSELAAKALQGLFGMAVSDSDRTWLGVVDEGAEYAHALYRFRFHADPDLEGSVGILSMRRNSTGWGVLWNGQGPFGLPGFGPNMYVVGRAAGRDGTA